jgi:hypothetical protein
MSAMQRQAIGAPCLLAEETAHPRYRLVTPRGAVIVTVNSGYE